MITPRRLAALAMLWYAASAATAHAQPLLPQPAIAQPTSRHTHTEDPAQHAAHDHVQPRAMKPLRPGDGIRLKIFREPEMSGEFIVDERGIVVLPRLGDWSINNIPADSVRVRLLEALTKYLRPEAIEISLFRRIAITGQVGRPGLYPVDPAVTVAEAIIVAGGRNARADGDFVEIKDAAAKEGPLLCPEDRVWDTDVGGNKQLHVPQQPWIRRNGLTAVTFALSLVGAIGWIVRLAQ